MILFERKDLWSNSLPRTRTKIERSSTTRYAIAHPIAPIKLPITFEKRLFSYPPLNSKI